MPTTHEVDAKAAPTCLRIVEKDVGAARGSGASIDDTDAANMEETSNVMAARQFHAPRA
ncbi:MAG: hypothetical protein AAGC53_19160 [Actinomycetota bacterium]